MTYPTAYNLAAAQLAEAIGAAPPAAQPETWATVHEMSSNVPPESLAAGAL